MFVKKFSSFVSTENDCDFLVESTRQISSDHFFLQDSVFIDKDLFIFFDISAYFLSSLFIALTCFPAKLL